jgi:hypothetical protein
VPGGGCPTVGVAGYMQGGGYGFTSREFGMNCDRVREFRIMLQNGATVTANETKNPDLFWAVRGGTGGNFGVLLDVTYELVALQNMWGFALRWPIEDGAAALEELQANWMGAAGDPRVSYQVAIANTEVTSLRLSGNSVVMMGMYDGTRVAGQKAIASLQKVGSPALVYDKASTYDVLNEDLISVLRGVPQEPGWTTYELKRCGYIAASLTPGDWETVLDAYAAAPNQWDIIGIEPYGGAITNPTRPNAFIHRNVSMDFFIDSFYSTEWTGNGAHRAQRWIDDVMTTMQPYFNGEVYQNYPWRGLADFEKAYWGTGYPRLQKVKLAADKDGFFHFEQGITPATPGSGDEGQIVIEADPS